MPSSSTLSSTRTGAFNNINVRQGLAAAINRTDLIDTVFAGTATPLYSQIPVGMSGHTDAFKTAYGVGPNYTLVKTDLAKAGYNANNKLAVDLWYETTGHYPQSPDQAMVLQKDLQASGVITVNLHGIDWPTMGADRAQVTWACSSWAGTRTSSTPSTTPTPFFQSSGASWLNDGYNSSAMDTLLAQSISATLAGTSIYAQIQTLQATMSQSSHCTRAVPTAAVRWRKHLLAASTWTSP